MTAWVDCSVTADRTFTIANRTFTIAGHTWYYSSEPENLNMYIRAGQKATVIWEFIESLFEINVIHIFIVNHSKHLRIYRTCRLYEDHYLQYCDIIVSFLWHYYFQSVCPAPVSAYSGVDFKFSGGGRPRVPVCSMLQIFEPAVQCEGSVIGRLLTFGSCTNDFSIMISTRSNSA